jgi:hypothetical protein
MKYRLLGKSGLQVSEAALGTMTFGDEWGWGSPKAEAQKVYETYSAAAETSLETIVPPASRTAATVASSSSTYRPQQTTKAPSRGKVKAASRPMPPVPVMMQTFLESLFDIVFRPD